ncbi:NAD(P)/FAD-dependent oxidoreductase [Erythrobacter sp. JK5]|uniref:NAD(P)/FAD-dependent oxidoreductase n=1 Tax=Erythrobacter sp. JK5 TaxID=2829500 RepID=UPI001BA8D674|nr:FAD-dependent oxidoreductase [Erythrobacter sp. JK5]QUL38330.1 FAD-dependent oxidoreductase [Erythrobacter sp. JK5]
MDGQHHDILIIGAGMAGLTCATRLAEAGYQVRIIDKGRGPGGRMAARRAEIAGEVVSFDHGAQYFTARDPSFREVVEEWAAQGVVAPWPAAGDDAWVGVPGMNGPIRAMADSLDVNWGIRAESIARSAEGWRIEAGESSLTAQTVLVAVPAEQSCALLKPVVPQLAALAGSVRSEPCWAVMAAFAGRLAIEADTLRDPDACISWAARNSAKPGRLGTECWVLHASPARSRDLLDGPGEEVGPLLLADFFDQTGADPVSPIHLVAHRWLYAMPEKAGGEPARYDAEARIGIAGDYLHSPRVEGAFLSGRALAEKVLAAA